MNDPLYLRFDCLELLEQDEIFPECKNRCFLYKSDQVTHHVIKNWKFRKSAIRRGIFFIQINEFAFRCRFKIFKHSTFGMTDLKFLNWINYQINWFYINNFLNSADWKCIFVKNTAGNHWKRCFSNWRWRSENWKTLSGTSKLCCKFEDKLTDFLFSGCSFSNASKCLRVLWAFQFVSDFGIEKAGLLAPRIDSEKIESVSRTEKDWDEFAQYCKRSWRRHTFYRCVALLCSKSFGFVDLLEEFSRSWYNGF